MTTQPINPELILRCAQESKPLPSKMYWQITTDMLNNRPAEKVISATLSDGYVTHDGRFNPLTSADDREALMLVLMECGYLFGFSSQCGGPYYAFKEDIDADPVLVSESFPMLLLLAASAEWGIPMYLEETEK